MKSIVETAREDNRLSISVRIADAGGAAEFLPERGPYTAFIPGDEAYTKIPAEKVEAIAKDQEKLKDMIMYHVVQGKLTARELAGWRRSGPSRGIIWILHHHQREFW